MMQGLTLPAFKLISEWWDKKESNPFPKKLRSLDIMHAELKLLEPNEYLGE